MTGNRKGLGVKIAGCGVILVLVALLILLASSGVKGEGQESLADASEAPVDETTDETDWSSLEKVSLNGTKYGLSYDVTTWLIIGTDHSGNQDGVGAEYQGAMADFLLLVVIDEEAKVYGTLQLNRDTMTKIHLINQDGEGKATATLQLCTAHWYGGNRRQSANNTVTAVSDLLGGIPIDGYYEIPMDSITEINHLVGGVTVTLEDDFTELDSEMEIGATLTLTDEQAYYFVHDRKEIGDGGNTSRMRRQKAYMEALSESIMEQGMDKKFLLSLFTALDAYAVTDVSTNDMINFGLSMAEYDNSGMQQLEGTEAVGQALGDGLDHAEFYADVKSVEEVVKLLYPLVEKESLQS